MFRLVWKKRKVNSIFYYAIKWNMLRIESWKRRSHYCLKNSRWCIGITVWHSRRESYRGTPRRYYTMAIGHPFSWNEKRFAKGGGHHIPCKTVNNHRSNSGEPDDIRSRRCPDQILSNASSTTFSRWDGSSSNSLHRAMIDSTNARSVLMSTMLASAASFTPIPYVEYGFEDISGLNLWVKDKKYLFNNSNTPFWKIDLVKRTGQVISPSAMTAS